MISLTPSAALAVSLMTTLFAPGARTISNSLPPLTGPYQVGTSKHVVLHTKDHDITAPNNISTSFLATLFYPTSQRPPCTAKPYLTPEFAALFEQAFNYTPGVLASLAGTYPQPGAPFLSTDGGGAPAAGPTLIFGPGATGPPVEAYTVLLSELASWGYAVFGLDHPTEQPFVRYPDGTAVYGQPTDIVLTEALARALYEIRREDLGAFVDHLPTLVVEELGGAPIDMARVGVLGHSLGGASSLGFLQGDDGGRVRAGFNMDGALLGPPALNDSRADVAKPSFLLGNEDHNGSTIYDLTWGTFPRWQTGYWGKVLVDGTGHYDFSDATFWKTFAESTVGVGPADGLRQLRIISVLVRAFFGETLEGREAVVLDGPSPDWPELRFYDAGGEVN
ncbi:hypothetical protein F4778DRAFT_799425 [Xylariomycetidae sp. FL2044]|nr:hypothetical protein F4778DRAFT_799425 [Xylariomycetidae sp. FL2044]